jgi:hypothetical protein
MFFCFGSPRSGTTLLAHCLAAHPDIIVPFETDFIVPTAFVFDRVRDAALRRAIIGPLITQSPGFQGSLGEFLSAEDVLAVIEHHEGPLHLLLSAIYARLAAKVGKSVAGDKSPNDIHFIRMLDKAGAVGPETRIIHIVRDPRDVLAALIERNISPGIETQYVRMWNASNLYLNTWMCGDPRYFVFRYEDFVTDPATHMQRALAHLGRNFDDAALDENRRHPRHRGAPYHSMLYEPIAATRIGSFRDVLDAATIERCEFQACEGMRVFGYR